MKADDDKTNEAIWAYLHGELSAERRREFEQTLKADSALRARLEKASRADLFLRDSLRQARPCDEAGECDALADAALAAWERDQAQAHAPAAASPARAAWVGWRVRPTWKAACLAAAALLALAVTPALFVAPAARWAEPAFSPLTYRGASAPDAARVLSPATAARCQEALSSALARLLEARGAKLPAGLLLSLRVYELRDGAFSVCVTACFRDGRKAGEWTGDFTSVEAYVAHAGSSAEAIAKELASFSGAGDVGGRP